MSFTRDEFLIVFPTEFASGSKTTSLINSLSSNEPVRSSFFLRSGIKRIPIRTMYNVPIAKKTNPNFVNSNIWNGSRPLLLAMELASMFVEVPINVVVPPKIAANDNGIKSLDPLILISSPTFSITGKKTATIGVLFTNADAKAIISIIIIMLTQNPLFLNSCIIYVLIRFAKPVFIKAPLITNIAAIVTVASLLNPDTPSSTVMIPDTINIVIISKAVRSIGIFSVEKSITATTTKANTIIISIFIYFS